MKLVFLIIAALVAVSYAQDPRLKIIVDKYFPSADSKPYVNKILDEIGGEIRIKVINVITLGNLGYNPVVSKDTFLDLLEAAGEITQNLGWECIQEFRNGTCRTWRFNPNDVQDRSSFPPNIGPNGRGLAQGGDNQGGQNQGGQNQGGQNQGGQNQGGQNQGGQNQGGQNQGGQNQGGQNQGGQNQGGQNQGGQNNPNIINVPFPTSNANDQVNVFINELQRNKRSIIDDLRNAGDVAANDQTRSTRIDDIIRAVQDQIFAQTQDVANNDAILFLGQLRRSLNEIGTTGSTSIRIRSLLRDLQRVNSASTANLRALLAQLIAG